MSVCYALAVRREIRVKGQGAYKHLRVDQKVESDATEIADCNQLYNMRVHLK